MPHEAFPAHRFYVEIAGVLEAVFTEVSGLQLELETQDLEVGGLNETTIRLPGRIKTSNLTLKRGITTSNEFLKWLMSIRPGEFDRRNISLVQFDVQGRQLLVD
jgi:phage tail-like protein